MAPCIKNLTYILLLGISISCVDQAEEDGETSVSAVTMFTQKDLKQQEFTVFGDRDTTLVGENGTKLTILQNTFVDASGNAVSGEIKIELKECLDQYSMVLGNLTTTSDGEILESGGMVYVNAECDGKSLSIATDKSILVEIPCDSSLADMKMFEGEQNGEEINWVNPKSLDVQEVQAAFEEAGDSIEVSVVSDTIHKSHNVAYNVSINGRKVVGDEIPEGLALKIQNKIFAGNGLKITKDSLAIIDGYKVNLYKQDKLNSWDDYTYTKKWVSTETVNTFQEDKSTSYIFSMKKLGWANIDRLFQDPRTKEIEWLASINNYDEYSDAYVSLVFDEQKIHLPGYIRNDGSFSFTHGDYEKTALPVGATAAIVVTAYKDDKSYCSIEKVTIKEKQDISLDLAEMSKEELKRELAEKL